MKRRSKSVGSQDQISTRSAKRFYKILGTAAGLLLVAVTTHAQVSGSENTSLFGYLGQFNSGVTFVNNNLPAPVASAQQYSVAVGPNACSPTAAADGLTYLENYAASVSQPPPLASAPTYASVNTLASTMQTFNLTSQTYTNLGGTYTTYMFNGLQSYLGSGGANPSPSVSISGQVAAGTPSSWIQGGFNSGMSIAQNTTPTAAFLANALNSHQAVELTLEWGTLAGNSWSSAGGGHEVTLDKITLNNSGTGTIQFVDPDGAMGSSAILIDATLTLGTDGYLYVSSEKVDSTGAPFYDRDNAQDYGMGDAPGGAPPPAAPDGRIDVDMIESLVPAPIPEQSTYALFGVGALLMVGAKFYRKLRVS